MNNVAAIHGQRNVRTVFISDVHLGFQGCSAKDLGDFLDQINCQTLYLVGDIIDFWALKKKRYWPTEHSRVLQSILRMAENGTRVVMVPGNHDETLRPYDGMSIGCIEVRDHLIHTTADGRRILVLHGDQFDSVIRCSPLLGIIGSNLYDGLLRMNTWINAIRRYFGKDYWSLVAYLKHKVKNAVQYIVRFEEAVATAARRENVDGVICGHIHRAEISQIQGITYMNCGDWVESCTALLENPDGRMELMHWHLRSAPPRGDPVPVQAIEYPVKAA